MTFGCKTVRPICAARNSGGRGGEGRGRKVGAEKWMETRFTIRPVGRISGIGSRRMHLRNAIPPSSQKRDGSFLQFPRSNGIPRPGRKIVVSHMPLASVVALREVDARTRRYERCPASYERNRGILGIS